MPNEQHGKSSTKEYVTWGGMIYRCHCPTSRDYHKYGARGIKVCDKWRDSFTTFMSDMGRKPSNRHSIERIDNDGDYAPDNCVWATPVEQGNNRRNSTRIEYKGIEYTHTQLADLVGVNRVTFRKRVIDLGWSVDKAVIPV